MARSVLIVDEDRNFREALAIALRLDGHEVAVAASPEEASTRLVSCRFACCVVDAHLTGADVILETAAASGAIAVAIGPYPELLAKAAARHPHAVMLAKPFRAIDLLAVLDGPARATG
jgi:DNA-binding NtrC family response regulator